MSYLHSFADISPDGLYRYTLGRTWGDGDTCVFIMLNPSVADAESDDPTIRRCRGFAEALGCGSILVANLYAYRATQPRDLASAGYPVGPKGDAVLVSLARAAQRLDLPLIAAWGTGAQPERVAHVLTMPGMDRLHALRVNKDGSPAHPVRLPASARPVPWQPARSVS